jgi:hypothetical protein
VLQHIWCGDTLDRNLEASSVLLEVRLVDGIVEVDGAVLRFSN